MQKLTFEQVCDIYNRWRTKETVLEIRDSSYPNLTPGEVQNIAMAFSRCLHSFQEMIRYMDIGKVMRLEDFLDKIEDYMKEE